MHALAGKTALVTGASRGIGRAIAQRLSTDGALVAVHYCSNDNAATETIHAIQNAGGRAFPIRAELGTLAGIDTLFAGLESGLKGQLLDILVNNAAIGGQERAIEETTPEEFDRMFAVNVRAPFFIIQRALRCMREGGRIVNISSAVTRIAIPRELAYSMTKGAVNTLGRTLAIAVGARGITVNTVAPGITETGKLAFLHEHPEIEAGTKASTALGRFGFPDDIAEVVAFLVSHDARWVTGQLLDVSGGLFLGPPEMIGRDHPFNPPRGC